MRVQTEPLGAWTEPRTPDPQIARFRASWSDTMGLLEYEAGRLGAELLVIQLDLTREQIRLDGRPRASASPRSAATRVSFTSMYGPLTYSTDQFTYWQDNVRAIALALQALRAVDRYGVNRRGEQYTGFLAIEAKPVDELAAARTLIESYGGDRAAVKATHPDFGGDAGDFDRVQKARRLLAAAAVANGGA